MALDIGLHLLGGDPLGYYRQPPEVRTDLAAYWMLMNDSESRWRWVSMGPARLADLSLHAIKSKAVETLSGLRAWLGANGVKFNAAPSVRQTRTFEQVAERALHTANARRCNASPKAVAFWLGG